MAGVGSEKEGKWVYQCLDLANEPNREQINTKIKNRCEHN